MKIDPLRHAVGICLLLGSWNFCSAQPAPGESPWQFYSTAHGNWLVENDSSLTTSTDKDGVAARPTNTDALPSVIWKQTPQGDEFTVRPDADKNTHSGKGGAILSWTVRESGNWDVTIIGQNLGTDVFGGCGGALALTRLQPGDKIDTGNVFTFPIPPSRKEGVPPETKQAILKLNAGDRLNIRLTATVDGYGNNFLVHFVAKKTQTEGVQIKSLGYEGFIPDPPAVRSLPLGEPIRPGMFWLGTGLEWSNSSFGEESLRLLKRFIPNLAVVLIAQKPETHPQEKFFHELKIPTIIQTWGDGYEPYLKSMGAFEKNWKGLDLSDPNACALSGCTHAMAFPHPASRTAFLRLIQSAMRSGYSGVGFCDMTWFWPAGRGATGYNPATIAAFQNDLQGLDSGLPISLDGTKPRTFKFADYARYYFGGMPEAADLGFKTWQDYQPITYDQAQAAAGLDLTSRNLLFDLLCHYEWLKFGDFMGRNAQQEGGFFQCMPNPEDMANGGDLLFLNALTNAQVSCDEYFDSPSFLDGAYYHMPYLYGPRRLPLEKGIVTEGGIGGNDWPYYEPALGYVTAYELTQATGADQMEADFWPGSLQPLDETVKDPLSRARYQALVTYGLAFTDAKADNASRPAPQFISVTSRRIFRPWGADFIPRDWKLDLPVSPEPALAQDGYVFEGIGEEGLQTLTGKTPVVLYSPEISTELGWQEFTERLKDGRIEAGIAPAVSLQKIVSHNFLLKPFTDLFPAFAFPIEKSSLPQPARLLDSTGNPIDTGSYWIQGPVYSAGKDEVVLSLGSVPLVVQRNIPGPLYIVLFDPGAVENRDLTSKVYKYLLGKNNISPLWSTPRGTFARLYRSDDMLILGVHNSQARDWDQIKDKVKEEARLPYKINGEVKATIQVPPGSAYHWLALPSGQSGESVAGADGQLLLSADGVSCQLFFLLPRQAPHQERLTSMAQRRIVLQQALTLGGRVPPGP